MQAVGGRRAGLLGDTLRRFVHRGARAHISNLLRKTRPEDVAQTLARLTPGEQLEVFRILAKDFPEGAGEVLVGGTPTERQRIVEGLAREDIARVIEEMPVDDAVDVVESLPEELREKVVEVVDLKQLDDVREHLTYEDDSAGRLMDPEFFALAEGTTVGEGTAELRAQPDLENIFYVYVVDGHGHLVGVTSLRQLLLAQPTRTLAEVMTQDVVRVTTETDQEEVAELATRYNLLAIPVTDEQNRLVGIVTLDDIIDVVEEEATEDFYKMVGTSDDELVYQDRSLKVAGFRLPWLLINMVGLALAGMLVERFQVSLKEALFLLTFVPVIMGMGGNIGSQTSTIVVRGMATGRIRLGEGQVGRFVWQQVKVGAVIGLACATLVSIGAMVLEQNVYYAGVVGTALLLAIVLASLNGAVIPILFQKFGIDPAVAAGPLVTTSNDITGILIYFGLAAALIDLLVR